MPPQFLVHWNMNKKYFWKFYSHIKYFLNMPKFPTCSCSCFKELARFLFMVFLPILLSLFSDLSVIHTVHLSNLKLNHNNFKSIYTKRYLIRQLAVLSLNPSIKATGIKLTHQTCFLNSFSEGLNHRVWEKRFVSMSGFT